MNAWSNRTPNDSYGICWDIWGSRQLIPFQNPHDKQIPKLSLGLQFDQVFMKKSQKCIVAFWTADTVLSDTVVTKWYKMFICRVTESEPNVGALGAAADQYIPTCPTLHTVHQTLHQGICQQTDSFTFCFWANDVILKTIWHILISGENITQTPD